jgi:hypothetical protein
VFITRGALVSSAHMVLSLQAASYTCATSRNSIVGAVMWCGDGALAVGGRSTRRRGTACEMSLLREIASRIIIGLVGWLVGWSVGSPWLVGLGFSATPQVLTHPHGFLQRILADFHKGSYRVLRVENICDDQRALAGCACLKLFSPLPTV